MYTFNAPPNHLIVLHTCLSEIVNTGRRRRSLKYNNEDTSYQRPTEDRIHPSNQQ